MKSNMLTTFLIQGSKFYFLYISEIQRNLAFCDNRTKIIFPPISSDMLFICQQKFTRPTFIVHISNKIQFMTMYYNN